MSVRIQVDNPIARNLFNALITADIYGDIALDSLPGARTFIDIMGSIEDYEQTLQPSLVAILRPEMQVLAAQGIDCTHDFLQATQDYAQQDLVYIAPERTDLILNEDAIDAYRRRRALEGQV